MSKIFLIPGLGADTRIYNNIDLGDNEVIPVNWIEPNKTDTLTTYAQNLIKQYNIIRNSIVIGNSLGGMLAIEIAKQVPLKKVILISSIKTVDETPWYFKPLRALPVHKILPTGLLTSARFLMRLVFGAMNDDDFWLFNDMLQKTSPTFVKWAIGAVIKWDNKTIPPNVHHITGDRDHVFDYKRIKDATIVKGGTHIMIFDKSRQINKWLKTMLSK